MLWEIGRMKFGKVWKQYITWSIAEAFQQVVPFIVQFNY